MDCTNIQQLPVMGCTGNVPLGSMTRERKCRGVLPQYNEILLDFNYDCNKIFLHTRTHARTRAHTHL